MKRILIVIAMGYSTLTFAEQSLIPLSVDVKKIDQIIAQKKLENHQFVSIDADRQRIRYRITFIPESEHLVGFGPYNAQKRESESNKTAITYARSIDRANNSKHYNYYNFYGIELVSINCARKIRKTVELNFDLNGQYRYTKMLEDEISQHHSLYEKLCVS